MRNFSLFLVSLISLGHAQIGPNGQICGPIIDDNDPDACLINSDSTFNGLIGEEIECEENYDCCLCDSIVCGAADGTPSCDKFVVNGDFGALGVTGIEIYGDAEDGVKIECGGDNSCQQIGLTGNNVQEIKCGGDSSCADALFNVSCNVESPCTVECDGDASCLGSTITVSNVDSFICGTDFACQGATITINDPTDDFKFECKGVSACENIQLTIVLDRDSGGVTQLEGIECAAVSACANASITIINNSPNALEIGELDCSEVNSCAGASITVGGSAGVNILNCECGDEGGCDGVTGFDAICDNIDATTAPVTPTITPTTSSPTAPTATSSPTVPTVATPAPVTPSPVVVVSTTEMSINETESVDSDSDSDSDESMDFDTTEADTIAVASNNFGSRRFRRHSAANAVGSESDTVSELLATDGDSEGDHVTISLSTETLWNLWSLCAVVVLVNITLCVWCQCKRNKAAKPQRFVSDDPYESDVNANV